MATENLQLKLYDTLTREKRVFTPIDPARVRMYVCGPTVYDFAHIGNARPVIVFDVLYRLLRHIYGAEHVTYVRNITDVDDKINARAAERGVPIRELTEETYNNFKSDVAALGCLPPTVEPRATDYVSNSGAPIDMIRLIERLIANENAYAAEGHVLFAVATMSDYGKLSKRSLDEMVAGARVEVAPYKRDPMDFVMWKPSPPDLPGWESPWGRGRPGWHIECSAMSAALLGETFDIHGGGIDLVFPHHENEIAQSRCAFHTGVMANYWMHNGFLQVEGEKMAKSAGNFVTIKELLEQWEGSSWPGESIRFNMLRTHYRQPIDWTVHGLDESHKILWDWYGRLESVQADEVPSASIINALCDDLNTPKAIAELHALNRERNFSGLLSALRFLGFTGDRKALHRTQFVHLGIAEERNEALPVVALKSSQPGIDQNEVNRLIKERAAARAARNFKESDRIRDELAAMGVVLKDSKDGTTWELAR